jgi:hypothetical protein
MFHVFWFVLLVPIVGYASIAPFRVQCSIYAHGFPGVADVETDWKEVVLEGEGDSAEGHRLIGEHGDYSFWVVTREITSPPKIKKKKEKPPEVHAYNAEIRNRQNGLVLRARSAGKGETPDGASFQASAALVRYSLDPATPFQESGQLSLHCRHPEKKERTK